MCPYSIVALLRSPRPCAISWISSHRAASHLLSQISRRITGSKISAPPPGIESSPADIRRRKTVSAESFSSWQNHSISTAVKHFMCSEGKRDFSSRSISSYQARS